MSGDKPQVKVGQIVGTHGVKGGLKVFVLTDFHARFDEGQTVWLKGEPRKIVRSNWHKDQVRIQIEGLTDMTTAEGLKWEHLTVPDEERPKLAKDEFMERDLIGLKVVTTDGVLVGKLDELIHSPAHDVFKIGEIMIPVVKQFVKKIDVAGGQIIVELIPGMLPEPEVE